MAPAGRFCPICEATMDDATCPVDGVPTVRGDIFDQEEQDPSLGKVFSGRYRIEKLLGEGGMGRVYIATQLSMGRQVALKTLHPEMVQEKRSVRRFYQEAKSASTLAGQHVVRIYDFGLDETTATPFIAMELLKGRALSDAVERSGCLPVREAVQIALQVAKALIEAEVAGIVHRDLKPDNIFLCDTVDGEILVKVMDFGIAKVLGAESDTHESLTKTGTTVGTPTYMSPEQAMGTKVDGRSDLYSLGCILFEMLVGHPPFESDERLALMMKHFSQPAPDLPAEVAGGELVPQTLRELQSRLLAKQPSLRPPTARATAEVLAAILRGEAVDLDAAWPIDSATPPAASDIATDETGVGRALSAVGLGTTPRQPSRVSDVAASLAAARLSLTKGSPGVGAFATPSGPVPVGSRPASATTGPMATLPQPARRGPWIAVAAVAVVAAAAALVWWSQSNTSAPAGPPSPATAAAPSAVQAPPAAAAEPPLVTRPSRPTESAPPPTPAAVAMAPSPPPPAAAPPPPVTPPPASTTAPPAPAEKAVVVTCTPTAAVVRDGKSIGHTPYTVMIAANAPPVVLELRAAGREPATVTVTDRDAPNLDVPLRPVRGQTSSAPRPPATEKPEPVTAPTPPVKTVEVPW